MDFSIYCLLLAVVHFLIVYVMAVGLKTSYSAMWAVSTISSGLITVFVKRLDPDWRQRVREISEGKNMKAILGQFFLGLLILLAGGLASFAVIFRAYGPGATLFSAGTNLLVSSI
jgi:hypothetical protein